MCTYVHESSPMLCRQRSSPEAKTKKGCLIIETALVSQNLHRRYESLVEEVQGNESCSFISYRTKYESDLIAMPLFPVEFCILTRQVF